MAIHYLRNYHMGERRNVRSETRDRYHEPWREYATQEEADAAPYVTRLWAVDNNSAENPNIFEIQAHRSHDYTQAGYFVFESKEAAKEAAKPCYFIAAGGRRVDVRMVWECEHKPANGTYYDTEEEARAALPPMLWVGHRFDTDDGIYEITEDERDEYSEAHYFFGPTREAVQAQFPSVIYRWSQDDRRYCRNRTSRVGGMTLYRVDRQLFRALQDNEGAFYIAPANAERPYDDGWRHTNTTRALGEMWNRWIANKRPETNAIRRGQVVQFMERVNAIVGRDVLAICTDCHNVPVVMQHASRVGSRFVCPHCANNYRACDHCTRDTGERVLHPVAALIFGDDGGYYCEDHRPVMQDPSDGELMSYSTNILNRKKPFLCADGEMPGDLWMGWELEVYTAPNLTVRQAVLAVREAFADYCICKIDSTISGGFEIVSIPATLQWHRENSVPFLRAMRGKLEGWQHDGAGLHVHVGRKGLTRLQEGRMSAFLDHPANAAFISDIAGRDPTAYCRRQLKKLANVTKDGASDGRYHALNFNTKNNCATVEFRLFRSNVSPLGFLKSLEFCHAVVRWARTCGNLDVAPYAIGIRLLGANPHSVGSSEYYSHEDRENKARSQLNGDTRGRDNFVQYVTRHRGEYPKLYQWLQEKGYVTGAKYEPVSIGA